MSIRVVVVDHSEILRLGLKTTLEAEGDIEVVAEFETGDDAVEEMGRITPDVVVMSVNLPSISGFEACRRITARGHPPRVVLLTSVPSAEEIILGISSGSAGYMRSGSSKSDLMRVVRANADGEMLMVAEVAELLMTMMRNGQVTAPGPVTDRERQILILVAQGRSNREVGTKLGLSAHTVRNHISRVCAKLGLSRRVELGAYAARMGYLSEPPDR